VTCAGELLHPGTRFHSTSKLADRAEVLTHLVAMQPSSEAVGFKFSPFHFAPNHHEESGLSLVSESAVQVAIESMQAWANEDFSLIHIYRRDRISQYASTRMALATGNWDSRRPYSLDAQFTISEEAYKLWRREVDAIDRNVSRWLADSSMPSSSFAYEDLLKDTSGTLSAALASLQIPEPDPVVISETVRSQRRPLSYVLYNLTSVQAWDAEIPSWQCAPPPPVA
jgi:hypothetical protein